MSNQNKETAHCLRNIMSDTGYNEFTHGPKIFWAIWGVNSREEIEAGKLPETNLKYLLKMLRGHYKNVHVSPEVNDEQDYEEFIQEAQGQVAIDFGNYALKCELIKDSGYALFKGVGIKVLSVTKVAPYLGNNVELSMRRDENNSLHLYFTGYRTTTTTVVGLCEYTMITRGFLHEDDWAEVSRKEGSLCDTVQETQVFDVVLHEGQQCHIEQDQHRTGTIWHLQNVNGKLLFKVVGGWSYGNYYIGDLLVSEDQYNDWVKYIS